MGEPIDAQGCGGPAAAAAPPRCAARRWALGPLLEISLNARLLLAAERAGPGAVRGSGTAPHYSVSTGTTRSGYPPGPPGWKVMSKSP